MRGCRVSVIARLNQPDNPRPPRRRRLRTIQTLPTLLTLGNLICGVAAVHFCMSAVLDPGTGPTFLRRGGVGSGLVENFLPTFVSISGLMIFVGMFFDGMDGRVARYAHRTSNFGGQLDSLADMVTFGVAPAVLMITVLTRLPKESELVLMPGRAIWVVGAIYTCCAALRLARFNVEHAEEPSGHNTFRGLPSPGAAATVAALVILHQLLMISKLGGAAVLANVLPYIVLACSLLMVSNVPYVHIANRYLKGRRPFEQFAMIVVALGVFLWHPAPVLVLFVCGYTASGPLGAGLARLRGRSVGTRTHTETAAGPREESRGSASL